MEKTKKILNRIFIDGLSGMALGLFSTLIIGTIIAQIGTLIGGPVGSYLKAISNVAKTLTGAGIGVGVACKFKEGPLVTVSAAVAGMIGAFPAAPEAITLGAPGEPLGAFVAAYVAIEVGHLVAGKTKVDILVTPLISICAGAAIGLFVGPYITDFMKWLGGLVNVNRAVSNIWWNHRFCFNGYDFNTSYQLRCNWNFYGSYRTCSRCRNYRMLLSDGWICSCQLP